MSGVDVLAAIDGLLDLARHRVAMKRRDFDRQVSAGKEPHHTVTIKADRAEYLRQKGEEARAAVAELIEAIKPLAELDLRPDGFDKRPDDQTIYARDRSAITVGDVRRAAAALARCRGGAA